MVVKSSFGGLSSSVIGLNLVNSVFRSEQNDPIDFLKKIVGDKVVQELSLPKKNIDVYSRACVGILPLRLYNHIALHYNRIAQLADNIKYGDFNFKHTLIKGDKQNHSYLSCMFIDERAYEGIDNPVLKDVEKTLGRIATIANHDPLMHSNGLVVSSKFPNMHKVLRKYIKEQNSFDGKKENVTETLSGCFHRCFYQRLVNEKPEIEEHLLKNIHILCDSIIGFPEKQKKYFNDILRYLMFSLINPESDILNGLTKKYPTLNFDANKWGKAIHNDRISLKGAIDVSIGTDDLQRAIQNDLDTGYDIPFNTTRVLVGDNFLDAPLIKESIEFFFEKRSGLGGIDKKLYRNYNPSFFKFVEKEVGNNCNVLNLFTDNKSNLSVALGILLEHDNWEDICEYIYDNYQSFQDKDKKRDFIKLISNGVIPDGKNDS